MRRSLRRWLPVAGVTAGSGLQRGLGALLTLVLVAVAARAGSAGDAAVVGVLAAVALVAGAFADFGTTPAMLRDFATQPPTRFEFLTLVRLRALAAVAAGLGVAAIGLAAGDDWLSAAPLAALTVPLVAIIGTATPKLVTDKDGATLGIAAVAAFLVGLGVAVAAGSFSGEPWALLAALPAARATEAAVLLYGCQFWRKGGADLERYGFAWALSAWPLAVYGLLQVVYLRGQVIVPALILDRIGADKVTLGFNVYSAGTLLPGVIALATWPMIVRAQRRYPERIGVQLAQVSALSLATVLPMTAVLLIAPGLLLDVLFGESPASLEAYLRWTALAIVFVGPNALMFTAVLARSSQAVVAWLWAAGCAIGLAANVVAVSLWGVAGAGVAVLAGEAGLFAVLVWVISGSAGRLVERWRNEALFREKGRRVLAGLGVAAVAGGMGAVFADDLVFPRENTGILALLAVPPLLAVVIWATGYDFFAPGPIFALTWSSALAVAQLPLFPSFNWSGEMWFLATVPPSVFAVAGVVGAGGTAFGGWARRPQFDAAKATSFILPLAAFIGLGVAGWVYFYQALGTIPLLSGRIDEVRFAEFPFAALVATRFGHVAVIVCGLLTLTAPARWRPWFFLLACLGTIPMLLSGGRLYPVSVVASAGVAGILIRGLDKRLVCAALLGVALMLAASSALWFRRLDQQADNTFKSYLDNRLAPSRPALLVWTIPLQMSVGSNMLTLGDLVENGALEREAEPGWFSLRFLDRFAASKDLEEVAREHSRFNQVTTTYMGEFYADFGLAGPLVYSVIVGFVYGLLYRWMRASRRLIPALLYAYSANWLVFSIFLGYWATHGVWVVDIPLIVFLGYLLTRARSPVPIPGTALVGPVEAPTA